jgi:xanthine dehydrogenase accessory factor
MKQWLETRQVLDTLAAWHAAGTPCALATVIRVRGSAYRHEGAKLLVAADGRHVGNVSGGCLEGDVREVAQRVIRTGVAERREYCGGTDDVQAWDLGVGCEGVVEVYIEPVRDPRHAERAMLADERAHVVCTDLESGARECHALEEGNAPAAGNARFVEILEPPPRLLIVSAGDDAVHLANLAASIGFSVIVADRRPGLLTRERFPEPIHLVESDATQLTERATLDDRTFAVVMTHHFADDTDYLRALLRTPARYLGVLGPRQRTERILGILRGEGPVDAARIFGPVGLDIGTDGAEQVALSVVAEMLAVRSGRRPQSLRDRRAPIHTPMHTPMHAPTRPLRIGAVVLAAGASTRMGKNKLLLPVEGEPMVHRTVRRVREAGCDPVVVVTGHEEERVRAALAPLGVRFTESPNPTGPTSASLHAGLRALPADVDAALVMLADMVHITTPMLRAVLDGLESGDEPLGVSRYGDVLAPPLVFRRSLWPELLVWHGEGCGKAVVRAHQHEARMHDWPVDALQDVDTPADYAAVR